MLFAHDCALEPWHVAKCTSCDPKQHARNIKTTLTFHKPAEDLTSEPSKTKISLTVTSHNIPSFRNDGCMMLPSIEPKRHHPLANLQAPCRRPVATHLTVNRPPPKKKRNHRPMWSLAVPFHPCWCPIPAELTFSFGKLHGRDEKNNARTCFEIRWISNHLFN